MNVKNTNINSTPEILKEKTRWRTFSTRNYYRICKRCVRQVSPIGADGKIANTADAVGILLYDVYEENPNGSIVKAYATINLANAEANSGLTIAEAVKTALANVTFE